MGKTLIINMENSDLVEDIGAGYLSDTPFFAHICRRGESLGMETALRLALQGEDEDASRLAIARLTGTRDTDRLPTAAFVAAARQAPDVDGDVAIALGSEFDDFEVTAEDGTPMFSTWVGDDGRRAYRVALGSGVHVCQDGAVLLPALPETILASLPGLPLGRVLDHPAFDGTEIIRDVVTRRMYGGTAWLQGVRLV